MILDLFIMQFSDMSLLPIRRLCLPCLLPEPGHEKERNHAVPLSSRFTPHCSGQVLSGLRAFWLPRTGSAVAACDAVPTTPL